MRHLAFIAIVAAVIGALCAPASVLAQQTRPLTVWIDSVRLTACGPKTFQTAIRAASFRPGDTTVGFTSNDYVASATLYVTWDPATLELEDLVITSGTMSDRIRTTVRKFPEESTLEIIVADDRQPFGILRGALPIVYINGRVRTDDTVAPPNGWIQVASMELTSDTRFEPSYRAGYVRVERDTNPANAGGLRSTAGAFDTLRLDTLTVSLEKVRDRRVREVSFSLVADTSFFVFIDTLQTGSLAAQPLWTTVDVVRTADTIRGRFVAASDLSQEGPLLKILIERTTDSSFATDVTVTQAAINGNSCLGGFHGFGAPVTASAIVRDTAPTAVPVLDERHTEIALVPHGDGRTVTVRSGGVDIDGVEVFDALGRRIGVRTSRSHTAGETRLDIDAHTAGPYYVQLRIGKERISKQFIFIK